MKNIFSLILAAVIIMAVFSFAACGNGKVQDDVTSMMEDATTLMQEVSSGLEDLAEDITENGNVTDESEQNGATMQDATNEAATSEGGENSGGLIGSNDTQTTAAQ